MSEKIKMKLSIEYSLLDEKKHNKTNQTNDDMEVKLVDDGNRHIVEIKAIKDLRLGKAKIRNIHTVSTKDVFATNGFQSWTETKERKLTEYNVERNPKRLPHLLNRIYSFDKYGDSNFFYSRLDSLHGYDLFYIKGEKELFAFNYNYENAYLIFVLNKVTKVISLRSDMEGYVLKKGDTLRVFDVYLSYNYEEGLKAFNDYFKPLTSKKILGYTSWYNYYQDIKENIILRDLDAIDNRFDLFQIDDGYETFVGDWLDIDSNKFPNGLKEIVDKIHGKGFKAGIWLAPFVAETNSKLYKEHPDWIKKDKKGKPAKCGCNWSGFYALDLENSKVKKYIRNCLEYFMDLGFDFFKLDFLYASMIAPTEGKTRAMMSAESYQFLRDILKDKLILGCGASCFSSHKKFDYLRIGPDVSLKFDDVGYMRFMHRERISTKVTLQNTIYRSMFDNHLFLNDPDVFLLRKENIDLSEAQEESLITINALFGSVLMTSDNIATYDEKTKKLLEEKLDLFYNATDKKFVKEKKNIRVSYVIHGEEKSFVYNTEKGTIQNG